MEEEVDILTAQEKFVQADELQKEVDFLKEILQKKKLNNMKTAHKKGIKNLEKNFIHNKKEICKTWNSKIEGLQKEMELALSQVEQAYKNKHKTLVDTFKAPPKQPIKHKSRTLLNLENTMSRLIENKKFSEVNYLKQFRNRETSQIQKSELKSQDRRFELKLQELERQRKTESQTITNRFKIKIEEKKKEKDKELANFGNFYSAQKRKTQHSQIREFLTFERESSHQNINKVKGNIRNYGSSVRNGSLLSGRLTRRTIFDKSSAS